MSFLLPLNDLIGPGLAFLLVGGAVTLAFAAVVYNNYLKQQHDAWAKQR